MKKEVEHYIFQKRGGIMRAGTKSFGTLLIVLLMSWLIRLFAGNLAVVEVLKKVCSVTWNS